MRLTSVGFGSSTPVRVQFGNPEKPIINAHVDKKTLTATGQRADGEPVRVNVIKTGNEGADYVSTSYDTFVPAKLEGFDELSQGNPVPFDTIVDD